MRVAPNNTNMGAASLIVHAQYLQAGSRLCRCMCLGHATIGMPAACTTHAMYSGEQNEAEPNGTKTKQTQIALQNEVHCRARTSSPDWSARFESGGEGECLVHRVRIM